MTDVAAPDTPETDVRCAPSIRSQVQHVVMLVNPLSGSVGPRAAGEAEAILADYDMKAEVMTLGDGDFDKTIAEAFDAIPEHFPVPAFFDFAETRALMWRERSVRHHRELIEAIGAGDGGWAEAVMAGHIRAAHCVIRRTREENQIP